MHSGTRSCCFYNTKDNESDNTSENDEAVHDPSDSTVIPIAFIHCGSSQKYFYTFLF